MEKHVPGIIAALFALAFFGSALWLSGLVRPRTATEQRPGARDEAPAVRIAPFYQILLSAAAMLFFGGLFLFPAIASFRKWVETGRGREALLLIGIFIGTLSIAFAHAWARGDLSWGGVPAEKGKNGNPGKRTT